MSWKTSSAMEEKLRFVFEYDRDEQTMTDLCRQFEVSRETGYVWLRRYRQYGAEGLLELNRAPERHPNQTAAGIERAVLELRQAHMRWGPRKLKRILERDQAHQRWPAASTIGELLKREGLVVGGAKTAAANCAVPRAASTCRRSQPGVVRRFQRLVPHRRRGAHRSADP